MATEEFKFPDETGDKDKTTQEVKVSSQTPEVEIEIVDDTPEQDRGRKPLDREVADPTDDEIEGYSAQVKARINELTHARHDERRAKEALSREKQELEAFARRMLEENEGLKKNLNVGREAFIVTTREKAEADLVSARAQLKAAHEAFDTDAIVEAQEKLAEAKMRSEAAKRMRVPPSQPEKDVVQSVPQQPSRVEPDEKSLRWQARNQWFGKPGFEEYTSYALGLHHKLVSSGTDPQADEYFESLDSNIRKRFPDLFEEEPKKATKPTSVVAPSTRSTPVNKVRLTATQLALAKKFNLTPQQYAAQVVKLEQKNG